MTKANKKKEYIVIKVLKKSLTHPDARFAYLDFDNIKPALQYVNAQLKHYEGGSIEMHITISQPFGGDNGL